jgi:hypothetical protein
MKDLVSKNKHSRAVSPAAIITGNGTTVGQTIDRQGYDSIMFAAIAGAITDGTFTVQVFESDDSGMAGESQVAAADLVVPGTASGSTQTIALANADANTIKKIGYIGTKRYVRVKVVQAGATTGGFIAVIAIQGHANIAPVL